MIVLGHFCIILEVCLLFEIEFPPTPIALVGPSNRFAVNLLIWILLGSLPVLVMWLGEHLAEPHSGR
jgi:hypothetical protein